MRLIDAEACTKLFDKEFKETMRLIRQGETYLDNLAEGFAEAHIVIRSMPSVDAVNVVRCKDCKHCCTIDTRKKGERSKLYYCRYRRLIMKDCDFCSEGERRTEENGDS